MRYGVVPTKHKTKISLHENFWIYSIIFVLFLPIPQKFLVHPGDYLRWSGRVWFAIKASKPHLLENCSLHEGGIYHSNFVVHVVHSILRTEEQKLYLSYVPYKSYL